MHERSPIEIFQPEFRVFGGEERVILSLARAIVASGRAVSLLCYHNELNIASFADFPIAVHALTPGSNPVTRARALGAHLAERYRNGAPAPMLCNIQSAHHAGFAVRSPYHLRIPDTFRLLGDAPRGLKQRTRAWLAHRMVGRGIRAALTFSTNTIPLRDEMHRLYGRAANVLHLGGIAARRPFAGKSVVGPVRLLSVSRLEQSKRIDWIITSLHTLDVAGAIPPWTLDIIGRGPEATAIEQLTARLKLSDKVNFLGFVGDDVLEDKYSSAHIFAMPAIQGYGIPAIEAVAHRLGVVLTTDSGVHEALCGTTWAVVTEPSPAAFTEGLRTMIQRVVQTGLLCSELPQLPTEERWAQEIIALSGW